MIIENGRESKKVENSCYFRNPRSREPAQPGRAIWQENSPSLTLWYCCSCMCEWYLRVQAFFWYEWEWERESKKEWKIPSLQTACVMVFEWVYGDLQQCAVFYRPIGAQDAHHVIWCSQWGSRTRTTWLCHVVFIMRSEWVIKERLVLRVASVLHRTRPFLSLIQLQLPVHNSCD